MHASPCCADRLMPRAPAQGRVAVGHATSQCLLVHDSRADLLRAAVDMPESKLLGQRKHALQGKPPASVRANAHLRLR